MADYYKFTGNPDLSISYAYGEHWKNDQGYSAVLRKGSYHHFFGGKTWRLPICSNCKASYHQIINLDINDPKISFLSKKIKCLPLIACLNCSESWNRFYYRIDNKLIISELTVNDTQHWIQEDDLKITVSLPKIDLTLEEIPLSDNPITKEKYDSAIDTAGTKSICYVSGAPIYLQNPINYECPVCKRRMNYVATVFSDVSGNLKDYDIDFDLGEMFLYYCFCDNCDLVVCETQGF